MVCFLIGLVEYVFFIPFGTGWYVAAFVLTVVAILRLAPKWLH